MNKLDKIRERLNNGSNTTEDTTYLLAEVERLQKENEKIKATVYVYTHVATELKDIIFGEKPVQEELFAKLTETLKEAEML